MMKMSFVNSVNVDRRLPSMLLYCLAPLYDIDSRYHMDWNHIRLQLIRGSTHMQPAAGNELAMPSSQPQ
jgi:hypothetical protein